MDFGKEKPNRESISAFGEKFDIEVNVLFGIK